MEYVRPDYYSKFSCIGGACEDTCCAGWEIGIDERSLETYRKYPGAFGNRLHNCINWEKGTFHQNHHRCAFLNEKELCDLYLEAGREYLCKTCRTYPRHIEEYEGLREISLSLSCPEAARIILGNQKKVTFRKREREGAEETYEYFDYLLFTKLEDARKLMIQIMQNRENDIQIRMAMVLALCHDMQQRLKKNELFGIDELLERYGKEDAPERFEKVLRRKGRDWKPVSGSAYFRVLYELEVLRTSWPEYLKRAEQRLYKEETDTDREQKADAYQLDNVITEQLMVYFLFVYLAGAVYDEKIWEKGLLAVYSTLMIQELLRSEENVDFDVIVDVAHRYAREVEHSDENLRRLEQIFGSREIFCLEQVLAWLLRSYF